MHNRSTINEIHRGQVAIKRYLPPKNEEKLSRVFEIKYNVMEIIILLFTKQSKCTAINTNLYKLKIHTKLS